VSTTYTLYGWHLSYFTGKALCYLRYKQAPFEHKAVDMFTLMQRIKRKTGRRRDASDGHTRGRVDQRHQPDHRPC
jgi:hypothetical protein